VCGGQEKAERERQEQQAELAQVNEEVSPELFSDSALS